jgi:uncharacterized delta-60 repeat protein
VVLSSPEPQQGNLLSLALTTAIAVVLALFVVATLHADTASAATVAPCTDFNNAIELNDGSVVAVGPDCLVKLNSSGQLVTSFGTDGIASMDVGSDNGYGSDGAWILKFVRQGDDFLVVTNTSIIRFFPNGTRDPAFGTDGRLRISSSQSTTSIVDAALAPDKSIFFAGFNTVTKLTPDGLPDSSFGTGGTYQRDDAINPNFGFQKISLDAVGQVLVAGNSYEYPLNTKAVVIRLTSSGDIDSSFGSLGVAQSAPVVTPNTCYDHCDLYVTSFEVDPDGGIALVGYVNILQVKTGSTQTFRATFGKDGEVGTVSTPSDPPSSDAYHVNPGIGFFRNSSSLNADTGNVVSAGGISGFTGFPCTGYCGISRGAIAKTNAATGEPDARFGFDGVAMPSPNACSAGYARKVNHPGPWIPCRIVSPGLTIRVAFNHVGKRHPGLRAQVSLTDLPSNPLFMTQEIRFFLPAPLRLTKGALKPHLRLRYESGAEGTYSASVKGRLVTVNFFPKDTSNDEDVDSMNQPLRLGLSLDPGAIRPIAKKDRKKRLQFLAKITLTPPSDDSLRWGRSTAGKVIAVSPIHN